MWASPHRNPNTMCNGRIQLQGIVNAYFRSLSRPGSLRPPRCAKQGVPIVVSRGQLGETRLHTLQAHNRSGCCVLELPALCAPPNIPLKRATLIAADNPAPSRNGYLEEAWKSKAEPADDAPNSPHPMETCTSLQVWALGSLAGSWRGKSCNSEVKKPKRNPAAHAGNIAKHCVTST